MFKLSHKRLQSLILITAGLTLLGRAYEGFFFDLPLRSLLWDQDLVSRWSAFYYSWSTYLDVSNDYKIVQIQQCISVIWLMTVLSIPFLKVGFGVLRFLSYLSATLYLALVLLLGKAHFYQIGQYFEYSLQFLFVLMLCFSPYFRLRRFKYWILIAIALTFTAHGLYAIGFYPRPGLYTQMTMSILSVSQNIAERFLIVMGILDMIAAIGLIFPLSRTFALKYCIIWGLLTALARLCAHIDLQEFDVFLHQWMYEFLVRIPHFMGPFIGYYLFKKTKS